MTDIQTVVEELSNLFRLSTQHLATQGVRDGDGANSGLCFSASKGTRLYNLQVDFAYLVDEITRGPKCTQSLSVDDCKRFIDRITKRYPVK